MTSLVFTASPYVAYYTFHETHFHYFDDEYLFDWGLFGHWWKQKILMQRMPKRVVHRE